MFEFLNNIYYFLQFNYIFDNSKEKESCNKINLLTSASRSRYNFVCPICSYNLSNTRCYELECANYGQEILFN